MNQKLKKAKEDIKAIEQFCSSRPIPDVKDLDFYIKSKSFEEYDFFAKNYLQAVTQKEWHFYQKKINKSR